MRKTLLILALLPHLAFAECYTRSSASVSARDVTSPPTDIERLVTPYRDQIQCNVKFRIAINGVWETAEGHAIGRKEDEDAVCKHAVNLESSYLLLAVGQKKLQAEQQMVCYDMPEYHVHPVNVGDLVHESEVAQHPTVKKYYIYQKSQCRYYAERNLVNGNLALYQGVMCQIDQGPSPRWQILDKW